MPGTIFPKTNRILYHRQNPCETSMTTSKTKVAHPKHEIGLFGVRLCSVSVMEHIIGLFPFNVKLLRRTFRGNVPT